MDWASGAFKVAYRGKRPVCGAINQCLGDRGEWTGQIVATPSPSWAEPAAVPGQSRRHLHAGDYLPAVAAAVVSGR